MIPDNTLQMSRQIAASPMAVWRCWTEPALLKQWFAPKPVETLMAEVDPVPGGRFNSTMRVRDHGDMTSEGCVLVAQPGARLVTTNMMRAGFVPVLIGTGDFDFPFVIDLTMTAQDGGCRYDVRILHADAAGAAKHNAMGFEQGWGVATDQLAALAPMV
ncbi:SRPBCC domain-containing protein [Yoonia sp.]|uniref:SRPBCC domain-containing protein n=1 Tax=Yoonia sp. TaxID=2212373 RepID=UPI003F6CEAD0